MLLIGVKSPVGQRLCALRGSRAAGYAGAGFSPCLHVAVCIVVLTVDTSKTVTACMSNIQPKLGNVKFRGKSKFAPILQSIMFLIDLLLHQQDENIHTTLIHTHTSCQ